MPAILKKLSNGMRVILAPCEAESVAFGIFIASGSRHETAKSSGISHLIEHMLFKGTPTRSPVDITRAIEGRGGNFNACTDEEMTCYYAHLPNEYLGEAVDIFGDMYLNASMPQNEFVREKQVVIEEIKMYRDEPDSQAMENLQAALFPGHPLGRPVAGTPESLGPLTPEDLRRHIRAHYLPTNTVVVVVGAFEESEAMRLLEDRFAFRGSRPSSRKPPAAAECLKISNHEVKITKPDLNQTQIALGYRTFGIGDDRKYAAAMMDAVLGRGMSSRLFQEVREKRGLSYDITSRLHFFRDAGMFVVTAGTDPTKAERALATVNRELKRMCDRRLGAAELKRTKEFMIGNFRLARERITAKMFFYGQTALAFGRLVTPAEQVEGIRRVSAEDVQAVAREILRPANGVVSLVAPATVRA